MIVANEKDVHAMVMESPEVKAAAMKALISPKAGLGRLCHAGDRVG